MDAKACVGEPTNNCLGPVVDTYPSGRGRDLLLLDLPEEIISHILSCLDDEDVKYSVPLWNTICRTLSRSLIRSVRFRYPNVSAVSKKIDVFPCVDTVAIHGVDASCFNVDPILGELYARLVRLERVSLKSVRMGASLLHGGLREIDFVNVDFEGGVASLGVLGKTLSVLRMHDCRGVACDELRTVLDSCENLEELSLEGMPLSDDVFLGVHGTLSFLSVASSCSFTWKGISHLRKCTRLKRLVLSACYNIDDDVCKAIWEALPQVEELGLFECGELLGSQGLEHLSCLRDLKTLDFGYVSGYFDSNDIQSMLKKLIKLRALTLSGTASVNNSVVQVCATHLYALEKLDISECQDITREGFMVLRTCHALKDVHIGWNARVTDDVLQYLPKTLRRLDVSFCSRLSGAGLDHVSKLENLEELCLRRCRRIGSGGIEGLSGCPNLSRLDISFTQIPAKALRCLKELKTLKFLDMSGCKYAATVMGMASLCLVRSLEELNLSSNRRLDDGCLHAISFHPGLRVLSIRHCPEVSDFGVLECCRLQRLRKLDLSGCLRVSQRSMCTVALRLNAQIVSE